MYNETLNNKIRTELLEELNEREEDVVQLCAKLLQTSTVNPPSDTKEIAELIEDMVKESGGEVTYHTKEDPVVNIVAKIKGAGEGKRLIFNGHLDTFPIGDTTKWTVDPLGGLIEGDRLYGRGASDMKGGVASSVFAFMMLAKYREYWSGEVVLVLVGDEESGGKLGTEYVLDEVPEAIGDVMIKGDAGSPMVLRFGEKGPFWLRLKAEGVAAHGAHMHLGVNALDKLTSTIDQIKDKMNAISINMPGDIKKTINESSAVSEEISGEGETDSLQSITVNVSTMNAGTSPNLVPASATAELDIRLPIGVTSLEVKQEIDDVLNGMEGVTYNILQSYDPNYSDINHEIFSLMKKDGEEIMGKSPVNTVRVGASDARIYRERDVPSINCGLTPYNMGAPDEHIKISELKDVAKIHALTAFDYLS